MTISGFAAYVKQLWKNKPDTSTPLSADRLTHMEDGIKMGSDAIEAIAAAVVSTITNDPDKIASMAALYAVNQKVTELNSNSIKIKRISIEIASMPELSRITVSATTDITGTVIGAVCVPLGGYPFVVSVNKANNSEVELYAMAVGGDLSNRTVAVYIFYK